MTDLRIMNSKVLSGAFREARADFFCEVGGDYDAASSNPTAQFAPHDRFEHGHAWLPIVEAGNIGKALPAVCQEDGAVLHVEFFQRFEAIGGKAGRDHYDAAHAALGEPLDGFDGGGLEPLIATEA